MTSPFITFRDKDRKGDLQYYVLQRDFPHHIGVVSPIPTSNVVPAQPVTGYNLWLVYGGTLRGENIIPFYNNVDNEMVNVLQTMAVWYYTDRIIMDKKKFKKYKV